MTAPSYIAVPTAELIPYARNTRTHTDEQISKIAASIREFGFLNPVIIDGDRNLIAGHGRLLAAQRLGLDNIPAIEATHLTEAQRRAYVIADNRLAEDAGWDRELLRVELTDLKAEGFDLDFTGFNVDEVQFLLGGGESDDEFGDDDEIPDSDDDPKKIPTKTTDGYVEFTLVMQAEDKQQLTAALRRIQDDHILDTQAEALMVLVSGAS